MTEAAEFRVVACDGGVSAAPRLVISCTGCGMEETVNDEEGGCGLGDLTAWAAGHKCRRPLSYVSVGDLVTPADVTGQWWSWSLAAIGITGLWLAGSERKSGWIVGIGVQALWIAYAIVTRQWGFIASAIAYGAVNTRNLVRWIRRDRAGGAGEALRTAGTEGKMAA